MKIRLLKKWEAYPIGSVIEVWEPKANKLIREKSAERYTGEYPPRTKMKTNFFKPKIKQ